MNKLKKCIVSLIMIILSFYSFSSAETIVKAARTDSPPVIDGKLTDACWQKAKPITDFTINNTDKPSGFKTTAYVVYTDTSLYVGIRCMDPDMKNLVANVTNEKRDNNVFSDDCVEIMIDPGQTKNDYFHFAVSALGARFDRFCREAGLNGNVEWDGEWKAKTFIGKDFWSCEAVFPFFALGITREVSNGWGINICRGKKKPFENSSIAEQGAFNEAGRFAKLEGIAIDFNEYCYTVSPPSLSIETKEEKLYTTVTVAVENNTGKKKDMRLECYLVQNKDNVQVKSQTVTFMPKEKIDVAIGPFILDSQGTYNAYVTLMHPQTRKVHYYSETKLDVKHVPMAIKLIEPFYRDAIFETQNIENIIFDLKINLSEKELLNKKVTVTIQKEGSDDVCVEKQITAVRKVNRCEFPCKELPYGNLYIKAKIKDENDAIIAETAQRLQKLPYKKGEVWLGRDRNWYVDGKPFFCSLNWPGVLEDDNPYYTVSVLPSEGKKRVVFTFNSSQIRVLKKLGKLDQYLKDFLIKKVKDNNNLDNPDCFGYYLADEPNGMPIEGMEESYQFLREMDPYHPVIISNNNPGSVRNYLNAADYHSFHCYPVIRRDRRINDLSRIIGYAKSFLDETDGKKFIGFLDQSFNYGDYDGMINQRIHNYHESRSKKLLAITCGAKGIIFFNRGYRHYPELYIGEPYVAEELAYLAKAIIAPDSTLAAKTSSTTAKTLLKDVNGELYLFVSNADMTARKITITIPGIRRYANTLQVISEDRAVPVNNDSFTDSFDVFEVHVYTSSKEKTGLTSIKTIEKKINAINRSRKKPGNLAFQMFEGDGVIISTSSNVNSHLWHVADGIIDKYDRYKQHTWRDTTPNKFPDWIEIKLPKAHNIGKVVVYPFEKSLKDYSVQAFAQGEWKEVDKVSEKNEEVITHTFKPVNTDRIRIWITATNGSNSKITEIEMYEK
ncbi:MAG: sugar-binding protein [bacterium]|nr:sugar-binding protein [bacterium]